MLDPQIEQLLVLQDRDDKRQKTERELERIPKERETLERKIADEESAIEQARKRVRDLELRREELDNEAASKREQVKRYKNQQLQVKKNDAYQALTHEIDGLNESIASLEDEELDLMMKVDEANADLESERGRREERIGELRSQIDQLERRREQLQATVSEAREAVETERAKVDPSFLEAYDRVKRLAKTGPYVVEVASQKCGGCHLRVSNDVDREARQHGEPHFCDQCGRIVYA